MVSNQDGSVKFIRNPQLKQIELRVSHYRQQTFDKHTHDTYSIGVVKQGRTAFFYRNQREIIGSGEVALINPGEVHACNPQKGSALTYCMLYVEPELVEDISSALGGPGEGLPYFTTPILRDGALYLALTGLCESIIQAEDSLATETGLYEVLAQVLQRYGSITAQAGLMPETSKQVKLGQAYLMEHLFQNVSLPELAAVSGLSPYHFLREFRKRYGLPPHTYQLQQRVNSARRLLASGQPIVHVAAEVGFADQSHFTRKFKAFVGATPRQYQRAHP